MDTTADSTTGAAAPEAAIPEAATTEAATTEASTPADGTRQDDAGQDDEGQEGAGPDDEGQDGGAGEGVGARRTSGEPSNKQKLLDAEGDAAADYLEELLDIADLDGDIDIFVENGRASVAVLADEADPTGLEVLVGHGGEVLDALQELTRLAAQAKTGERSRLLLDIAGFRENRRSTAAKIAAEAVSRVRASGESVELEPMPAYQRKAVHDAVAEAGLRSESDGAEPRRFVVVHPS